MPTYDLKLVFESRLKPPLSPVLVRISAELLLLSLDGNLPPQMVRLGAAGCSLRKG